MDEEWVAACYSRDLRYIGRIIREGETTVTVKFLERRADGVYGLKKKEEETEKRLVFMRKVKVNWIGTGRYEVPDQSILKKNHDKHWKLLRSREKVKVLHLTILTQLNFD